MGCHKKSKNTTRKQQAFSYPFAMRKRPNQPGRKPMFCVSAVHSKAALLNWIKGLCALKRVLTLAEANSVWKAHVLRPKPMCVILYPVRGTSEKKC